jgi:predicted ferric reductase
VRRATSVGLVALYVVLVCTPLIIAAAPPRPPGRSFGLELAVAIGFLALGQTALQFGLIARFERLSRPFGIDLVMRFHRHMGALALAGMVVHGAMLVVLRPGSFGRFDSRAGLGALAGIAAVAAILAIVVLTLTRKRIGLAYEGWRVTHAVLAVLALVCAQIHVSQTGLYAAAPWKELALAGFSGGCVALVVYLNS